MSVFEAEELNPSVIEIVVTLIVERRGVKREWHGGVGGQKGGYGEAPSQEAQEVEVVKLRLPAENYSVESIVRAILDCGDVRTTQASIPSAIRTDGL